MVKFKDLVKKPRPTDTTDLLKIFDSLDRKTSHTDPRPAQEAVFETLSERRAERDLILKLSTGAGKTAAGLLYLQSHMLTAQRPVVYLCPTRQLVDQACHEAQSLGLQHVTYPARQPHPGVEGMAARAIIICTYDKLFNGRSTFDRDDVHLRPCAIVLDDAHVGLDRIRASFTVQVTEDDERDSLLTVLGPQCKDYNPTRWQEVMDGDPRTSFEVPYWIWKENLPRVRDLLSSPERGSPNWFVWPLVADVLRWSRCIVSGGDVEIVPDVLPVERCAAFAEAAHRLFMSATLADDSVLVRDLGCDPSSAGVPVRSDKDKGVGERMVLAPTLVDKALDVDWVKSLCSSLSTKHNVVVLCPSEKQARTWQEHGATVAIGDDVAELVAALKNPSSGQRFAALAQRYDGVDLPDDSCRILVIDGVPRGEGIADRFDSTLSPEVQGRLIHRIEQGMGRAVRSHADYAVVLLAGNGLANFIAHRDVLDAMNPDTRAQLELALELARLAQDEEAPADAAVRDLIKQCLGRDPDWKQFYDEKVRQAASGKPVTTDPSRLAMAAAERRAFDSANANDTAAAAQILRNAINEASPETKTAGAYLQRVANYVCETDPGEAISIQRAAFDKNRVVCCPPTGTRKPPTPAELPAETKILKWFSQFGNPNGAIAAIGDLRGRLAYSNAPASVEQALADLAQLLGAEGSRPEDEIGEGPDDLWLWPSVGFVVEAKTDRDESLHKKDGGQLLQSIQWFGRSYPTLPAPKAIVAAKVDVADRLSDFPDGTRVMTWDGAERLLKRLEEFYRRVIQDPLFASQPSSIRDLLQNSKLLPESIVPEFTVPLRGVKKGKS